MNPFHHALASLAGLTLILTAVDAPPLPAQAGLTWSARFDGAGAAGAVDNLRDLGVDSAGNSYVTGASMGPTGRIGAVTIKYDAAGQRVWLHRYESAPAGGEEGVALTVGADALYVAGRTEVSGPAFPGPDILLLKYDLDGNLIWARTYDGPAADGDFARAIALDGAGNIVVLGQADTSTTAADLVLLKYAPDGTRLWATLYDGPGHGNDRAFQLAIDGAGNIVVSGAVPVPGTVTSVDVCALMFSPAGVLAWERFFDGEGHLEDSPGGLWVDGAGNAYLTAGLAFDIFSSAWWTAKLAAADGAVMWERTDPLLLPASPTGLVLTPGDEVVVSAFASDPAPSSLVVVRYDAAGNTVWRHIERGMLLPTLGRRTLAAGNDGGIHALGIGVNPTTGQDFQLVSLSAAGTLRASVLFGSTGLGADLPVAVSAAPDGTALLAGDLLQPGTQINWDYGVARARSGVFADGFESGDTGAWTTIQP